jgi:glycosyltransferase involved in cell wall biosynthesis
LESSPESFLILAEVLKHRRINYSLAMHNIESEVPRCCRPKFFKSKNLQISAELKAIENAEKVYVICQKDKDEIQKKLQVKLDKVEKLLPIDFEKKQELIFFYSTRARKKVVFTGNLKNYPTLLGLKMILNHQKELWKEFESFIVIGDLPRSSNNLRHMSEDNVKFTGYLPRDVYLEHIGSADLILLNSQNKSGILTKIPELRTISQAPILINKEAYREEYDQYGVEFYDD